MDPRLMHADLTGLQSRCPHRSCTWTSLLTLFSNLLPRSGLSQACTELVRWLHQTGSTCRLLTPQHLYEWRHCAGMAVTWRQWDTSCRPRPPSWGPT